MKPTKKKQYEYESRAFFFARTTLTQHQERARANHIRSPRLNATKLDAKKKKKKLNRSRAPTEMKLNSLYLHYVNESNLLKLAKNWSKIFFFLKRESLRYREGMRKMHWTKNHWNVAKQKKRERERDRYIWVQVVSAVQRWPSIVRI